MRHRPTDSNALPRFLLLAIPLIGATGGAPLAAATIAVTSAIDVDLDDAECSLREAILAANDDVAWHGCPAGSGPDRIEFDMGAATTIALAANLPPIEESLLLRGPESGLIEIDGQELWRQIDASTNTPGVWLGVENLRLVDGSGDLGGAVVISEGTTAEFRRVRFYGNTATSGGGAIAVVGTPDSPGSATLIECELWNNGSLGPSGGGAIRIVGPGARVVLESSTVAASVAEGLHGGAVSVQNGELVISRSTLSGNSADGSGGAIHFSLSSIDATLSIVDSTISDNRANLDADGTGDGGGVSVVTISGHEATLAFRNSIVAANFDAGATDAPDLFATAATLVAWETAGFNLIGSNAGMSAHVATGSPNVDGDLVGDATTPLDPRLDPLNNWPAEALATHRPQLAPLSPAIDAGSCPEALADQRGFGDAALHRRAFDIGAVPNGGLSDGCDIGAHERAADSGSDPALFVNGFEEGNTLRWSSESP